MLSLTSSIDGPSLLLRQQEFLYRDLALSLTSSSTSDPFPSPTVLILLFFTTGKDRCIPKPEMLWREDGCSPNPEMPPARTGAPPSV